MTPKCLTNACMRPAGAATGRGLCMVCYSRAKKMVEAGTTTWREIVDLGLAMPNDVDGDPFTTQFNEAKKKGTNADDK